MATRDPRLKKLRDWRHRGKSHGRRCGLCRAYGDQSRRDKRRRELLRAGLPVR